MRLINVVLPAPVEPTTAVVCPGRIVRFTSHNTGSSAPGYRNSTSRNSTTPVRCAGSSGAAGSTTLGSVSSTAVMRSAEAAARGTMTMSITAIITLNRICIM